MLRLLSRFFGLILLAGGFIALVVDGTKSIAVGGFLVTPVWRAFSELFPAHYTQFQTAVESVAGFLWDPLLLTLMLAPLSLTLGALGAAMIVLGQNRASPGAYASR